MKRVFVFFIMLISCHVSIHAARYMEKLDRGVVAVRTGTNNVYVGWRMFATDPSTIAFNVYRSGVKVNATPITTSTNYNDATTATGTYTVRPVIGGVEQADSETASVWPQFYMTIPMTPPAMETMPDGVTCTYSANDCSVGDLDGDGKYEIVVKWDPSNSKDNSQSGYTGDVFLDAYKLNGTRLWRIDLGRNIRAGAHYTQFMVYDLDSDGKAEVACKTAPGTKDSSGAYLGTGPAASDDDNADYRNSSGYILSGPEYLTVFNGQTGREIATVNYNPPRGTVSSWGDSYGNRVDRFLACVAYLDGVHPSLVMCRGYYTRMVLAAWDFNGTSLTQRWTFDSNSSGNSAYAGQGNHNLSVADVDGDGKDEIIYGASAFDDNGKGMYTTGLGHGDAMHLGKLDPDRPGLQVWEIHEAYPTTYGGGELHDAATGQIIWGVSNTADTGRGMAADVDANYRGYEMWSFQTGGVDNVAGTNISSNRPTVNFRIYWDGDLQDELLDGTKLDKWTGNGTTRLVSFYNYMSATENNGTKANPGLTADILGDWREEAIYRSSDSTNLIIFTTTTPTNYRFYTLMHDFQYRCSVAWQNVAYNQPPHVSFYMGDGPSAQPVEAVVYPGVTPSPTQTASPAVSPTFTAARTFTQTFTRTSTQTYTPTPTSTFTVTRTYTPTVTQTSTAAATPTISRTWTQVIFSPTFTPSWTRSATPTMTAALASPTSTRTYTATATQTFTSTTAPTLSFTPSATPTYTRTPQPTATFTPTSTYTATATPSATMTVTNSPIASATQTYTASATSTPVPAGYTELQAESACSYDGIFETIHPGYLGTGYANLNNTTGSSVMFFVDAATAQSITFTYRYANGSVNSRDMSIMVNDVTQPSTLYFPTTGSWDVWQTSSVTVPLTAGRNEITIVALTAEGGPNMDMVSYASTDVTLASCVAPATPTEVETDTPQETPPPTETVTPTWTYTATDTPTDIVPSPSATASVSSTATDTITPTWTSQVPTVSPGATASVGSTVTITITPTQTSRVPTSTPSATATPAMVASETTPAIYPNPYTTGTLSIGFITQQIYKEVDFRVYTTAFRLVLNVPFKGSYTGNIKLDIAADRLSKLGGGSYYYTVTATDQAGRSKRLSTGVLTIVK